MNRLVKITHDEDGTKVLYAKWCLSVFQAGSPMQFCTGQVYGFGEGDAQYKEKQSEKGITCPKCREIIKEIKAVKL